METGPVIAAVALAVAACTGALAAPAAGPLPERLSETGLYRPGAMPAIQAGVEGFTPQYALWSDGAEKRRWIALPAGAAIDGSRPAAWQFPAGTRFWKEFSVAGRRVETRMIERLPDGEWRFAAYVWNEAQTDATLAPAAGVHSLRLPGGERYTVPGEADCRACHEGGASTILGFTALQLSPDRDALTPRAERPRPGDLDLRSLAADDRLRGFPRELIDKPPRIDAPTATGRAVLGYLNANCGHCHADPKLATASVPVDLQLAIDPADPSAGSAGLRRLLDGKSRFRPRGAADARLVVPGDPQAGALLARMRSRDPRIQMPPIGTVLPDLEAIALFERWIASDLTETTENPP